MGGLEKYHHEDESNDEQIVNAEVSKWELSLKSLKENIAKQEVPDFEVARRELLGKSYANMKEKNLKGFRDEVKKDFDNYKYRAVNAKVLSEVYSSEKEKVLVEKLRAIHALLEKYELQHPTDIMDRDVEEIHEFGHQYSQIVGIPEDDLIESWVELRGEQLEWDKLQKLLDTDTAASVIYAHVESGEEVAWYELYDQYSYLLTDIEDQQQDLEEELADQTLEEEPDDPNSKDEPVSIQETLDSTYLAGRYTVNTEGDKLLINGVGEMRASVKSLNDNQIEITDEFDRVVIDSTDPVELSEVLGLFEIKTVFQKMVERDHLRIEPQFRPFFFGVALAKFVAYISREKVRISGEELDQRHEIETIYKVTLNLSSQKILDLEDQLSDSGPADYDRLALELGL